MKVYGHPASTCTQKVLATLAEKGQKAEFVLVDLLKGEQKSAEHLARQPFGVVPVFEDDDGFSMHESRAIIRYLDAKFPENPLTPADLKVRAEMEQWISVEHSYFSPAAMKFILEIFFAPMKGTTPDQDVVNKGRAETSRVFDILEKHLVGKEYLAGSTFTLADISWAPYMQYIGAVGSADLIESHPNVAAWWKRVSERPSWQIAIGKG